MLCILGLPPLWRQCSLHLESTRVSLQLPLKCSPVRRWVEFFTRYPEWCGYIRAYMLIQTLKFVGISRTVNWTFFFFLFLRSEKKVLCVFFQYFISALKLKLSCIVRNSLNPNRYRPHYVQNQVPRYQFRKTKLNFLRATPCFHVAFVIFLYLWIPSAKTFAEIPVCGH